MERNRARKMNVILKTGYDNMTRRVPSLLVTSFLWIGSLAAALANESRQMVMPPVHEGPPRFVSTFTCLSIYWAPPEGASANACEVSYRTVNAPEWQKAMPLWFDPRNKEYRGSIVSLQPGSRYEVRLQLADPKVEAIQEIDTWPANPPIAKTITLPEGTVSTPYIINEGGTHNGYILYTSPEGQKTTIDVAGQALNCIEVNAPYVVIRGLNIKGGAQNGILLGEKAHDVYIEHCDISGWGRIADDGWGVNVDSGIRSRSPSVSRIVIRENLIHHPRSNSNDWSQFRPSVNKKTPNHPAGPQAIYFQDSDGNNVICHNEVYSDEQHRFNDGIGGGRNFSTAGFPGADSDVYGNIIRNVCDDALEIEGGGSNVRVFENYMEWTFTGTASCPCNVGPLYIYRNVLGRTRIYNAPAGALDYNGVFGKSGDVHGFGGGRVYYFNNILFQPPSPDGSARTSGAARAFGNGPVTNTVSRNNIWWVAAGAKNFWGFKSRNPERVVCIKNAYSPTNDLDWDLLTSSHINAYEGAEAHAIHAVPIFSDTRPDRTLFFGLAPTSPGIAAGQHLPNFTDSSAGMPPDLGAQQTSAPPIVFGRTQGRHVVTGIE